MQSDPNSALGSPSPFTRRRLILMALGFAISGAALWYVFKDIDFAKLVRSAGRIRFLPLLGSLITYWCGAIVIRSLLVRNLLSPIGALPAGKAYRYICIGLLANSLLPLRMGEVVRIGGMARASGLSFPAVTGALAVERLLDMVMAILLCILAARVAPLPESLRLTIITLGSGLIIAFAIFTFLARRDLKERPVSDRNRYWTPAWNLLVRLASGFGVLSSSGRTVKAILLSALLWLAVIGAMLLRLSAFDLPARIPVVLVLLSSIALSVSLPSAPSYLGVYHAAAAAALILFGVEDSVAVGFAIFSHIVDVVPACLLGAVGMVLEGMGWSDLKRTTIP